MQHYPSAETRAVKLHFSHIADPKITAAVTCHFFFSRGGGGGGIKKNSVRSHVGMVQDTSTLRSSARSGWQAAVNCS